MNKMKTELSLYKKKAGISIGEFAEKTEYGTRVVSPGESREYPRQPAAMELFRSTAPRGSFSGKRPVVQKPSSFTFIDLFAGIGGMRKAFEGIGGKCVFTSESDEACKKTYFANFECNHPFAGDITKTDHQSIPRHNLLLAGFPCQPFSVAGVSKKNSLGVPHGFSCTIQGTLFFELAKIIEYHRPEAFLLENVKNLLSHDKGNTFRVIIQTLEKELGYHVQWKIINAKGYLPQNRERVFIAGFRNKSNFCFENINAKAGNDGPLLSSILHPEDGSEKPEYPYTEGNNAIVAEKYILSDKLWQYLQNYASRHRNKGNGFGYGLCSHDSVARTLSARYYKDGAEILICRGKGKNPRRLTPRECARLMGFDGGKSSEFKIPVSDTQAYKQYGNSVAIPVVKAIAEFMYPYICEAVQKKEHIATNYQEFSGENGRR